MKKKQVATDSRVTMNHISWKAFITTFLVLCLLSGLQAMIFSGQLYGIRVPIGSAVLMILYWAVISFLFCFITKKQISSKYDEPMHRLSKAAGQVANGDFSVWAEPVHKGNKKDYIDIMFEDFNTMVAQLGKTETLQNDFITSVSHEFKTPLAVIQGYSLMLQKDNLTPEERGEYSDTLISASQKLSTLVANILKLNKLENQEIIRAAEPYDLCRQLCDCALSFERIWEEKEINFEVGIEEQMIVYADESLLEIVWNNLISNALKFTESAGTVTLKQYSDEHTIMVSVSDTGCGMSDETAQRIFDKFYQGDTSRSEEGNGLGLALSLRAIELSGGTVSVVSELGTGTTFTVCLDKKYNM